MELSRKAQRIEPSVTLAITAKAKEMKENGVEVGELQVMPYGKMFSFKDQDGNAYLLREDK